MTPILERAPVAPDHRLAFGALGAERAELFLPEGPGPWPLVVTLHGGFWRVPHGPGQLSHLCRALAGEGFAALSLGYLRVGEPGGGHPGTEADVRAGLHLARSLAGRFPVDPARLVLLGHSAGGHLALQAARDEECRGVVALAAITDLRATLAAGPGMEAARDFLGGAPEARAERLAATSPLERLPVGRRQILIHGEADSAVPIALARRYCEAARAAGDRAFLRELDGLGHFDPIDPCGRAFPVVRAAIRELLFGQAQLFGPRLSLEPLGREQFPWFVGFYADPEVMTFIGHGPRTPEDSTARLERHLDDARRPFGHWMIRERQSGTPLGAGTLMIRSDGLPVELGFALTREARGRGIASEAAQALLAHAFTDVGVPRVEAFTAEANQASVRVLLRAGFTEEGRTRGPYGHLDRKFGLTRQQWEARQQR